jgi:hypothetical protein
VRPLASLVFVTAVGCASSGTTSQPAAPPQQTVRVGAVAGSLGSSGGASAGLTIVPSGGPNVLKVSAPVDAVWRALPAVYDSLAVPVTTLSPQSRTIGNEGFKIRRRLGKTQLSRYLECGRSQVEQNADEYEINLSVLTTAQASDSTQTTVTTTVQASAKGLQFAGQFSQCTSKGELEARLQRLLKQALEANARR